MKIEERKKITSFYNENFEKFGRDVRSVGWRNKKDQWLRFEVLFRDVSVKNKTILDVGCGLGDLVGFLNQRYGEESFNYIGIDLSDKLIVDARNRWGEKNHHFLIGDLSVIPQNEEINIAVSSGALTLKLTNNEKQAREMMEAMYIRSSEMIALNFLTKYVDYELEKNHHFQPEEMFSYAKKIAKKVSLFHDYPLWEFTLQIYK